MGYRLILVIKNLLDFKNKTKTMEKFILFKNLKLEVQKISNNSELLLT